MIKHFLSAQFAGFILVGASAAFLNWSARLILSIWLPFSTAVVIAYLLGMMAAFLLNSVYVFPKSDKPRQAQARDFIWVNLSFVPVVWFASVQINFILKDFGFVRYSEELAHAIAIAIPMFATFLLYKFFAFRENYYNQ